MLAVVLSFDRFPLGLLGCYGNTTVETPCLDHIAAASTVFDQHFGEDFSANPSGHAWWSGCHHFPRPGADWVSRMPSLPGLLAAGGVDATWIMEADSSPLVPMPSDASVVEVSGFEEIRNRGSEWIEAGADQPDSRQLLWLKVGESVWDFAALPEMEWSEEEAPWAADVLDSLKTGSPGADWSAAHWLIYREMLETAVEDLDSALAPLWEQVRSLESNRRVMFLITSARGMLLGTRAQMPTPETSWVEDFVHLPLIAYHSSYFGGERHLHFTQTTDLPATLLDFFACPNSNRLEGRSFLPLFLEEPPKERETLTFGSQGVWGAVRTREFYFVRLQEDKSQEPRHLLFMKPEDMWDWHDVSAQEPEMTETLSDQLDKFINPAADQIPFTDAPES